MVGFTDLQAAARRLLFAFGAQVEARTRRGGILHELRGLEDLPHELLERLRDLDVVLRARLYEEAPVLPRKALALFLRNLPVVLLVDLVPHDHLDRVRNGGVHLDLVHPQVLQGPEGVSSANVVGEDNALGAPVVAACQRPEPLLTSSVPYRQLEPLSVQVEHLQLEVHPYRGTHVLETVLGRKPHKDRALANAAVPDEENLEKVVEPATTSRFLCR